MPSSTTGAGAPSGHGGETISSGGVSGDENQVNDAAVIEDITQDGNAPEDNAVVEERERNLHSKKHRR